MGAQESFLPRFIALELLVDPSDLQQHLLDRLYLFRIGHWRMRVRVLLAVSVMRTPMSALVMRTLVPVLVMGTVAVVFVGVLPVSMLVIFAMVMMRSWAVMTSLGSVIVVVLNAERGLDKTQGLLPSPRDTLLVVRPTRHPGNQFMKLLEGIRSLLIQCSRGVLNAGDAFLEISKVELIRYLE